MALVTHTRQIGQATSVSECLFSKGSVVATTCVAITFLALGMITFCGIIYPESSVGVIGTALGGEGGIGISISGAILLVGVVIGQLCISKKDTKDATSNPQAVQRITHFSSAKVHEYYAMKGDRFEKERFKKFIAKLQEETKLQFITTKNDPGKGHTLLVFDYYGRHAGDPANPFSSEAQASLLHVVVTPDLPKAEEGFLGERDDVVLMIYDPDSLSQEIDGIPALQKALGMT